MGNAFEVFKDVLHGIIPLTVKHFLFFQLIAFSPANIMVQLNLICSYLIFWKLQQAALFTGKALTELFWSWKLVARATQNEAFAN